MDALCDLMEQRKLRKVFPCKIFLIDKAVLANEKKKMIPGEIKPNDEYEIEQN